MRRRVGRPLGRVWRWAARNQFLAAVIVFTLIVAGAFVRDAYREAEADRYTACIAKWADDSTARSVIIAQAGADRVNAADALWRDFAQQLKGPPDRKRFEDLLAAYIAVSDELRTKQRDNPVPEPPRIRC